MDAQHANALTKKDYLIIAALLLAALGIRIALILQYQVISADGIGYASCALNFIRERSMNWAAFYPPVYPLLMGLGYLVVPDIEMAGRLVAIVMGSMLVFPVYLLGAEFFTKRVGLMACMLVIVWPSLRFWSSEVMTQSTYITLILSGIYLAWRGVARKSPVLSAAAGLFMVLAYLTRPEAIIVFVLMILILAVYGKVSGVCARDVLIPACAISAGFALLFLPYVVYIHSVTGQWQLTGKTGLALADALSEYLGRPDMKREPGFQPLGLIDVLKRYPDFVVSNFAKNLKQTWETMLPLYLWGFSLLGFIWSGWSGEKVWARLFLLSTFAPLLLIITFFFVGPEYIQPYLPIMFLWTSQGICRAEELLWRCIKFDRRTAGSGILAAHPLSVAAVAAIAMVMLYQQIPAERHKPYHYADDEGRYDHKRIGLLLKEQLPQKTKIMTRWGRISFYAERDRIDMPQAPLAGILSTARAGGAKYIVVDGMLANVRPQLGVLLHPLFAGPESVLAVIKGAEAYRPLPDVRLYLLFKEPASQGVAVYELLDDEGKR